MTKRKHLEEYGGLQAGLDRLDYTPPPAVPKGPRSRIDKHECYIGTQPYHGPGRKARARRLRRGRRCHTYTGRSR